MTATAITRLEATLASIEAAATAGLLADRTNKPNAPPGAKPARGAAALPPAASSVDTLSKELVRAKLAEAEAVRKLRVSARAELELRQQLLQREERVAELKRQLSAAAGGQHVQASLSFARGGLAEGGGGRARSVSPSLRQPWGAGAGGGRAGKAAAAAGVEGGGRRARAAGGAGARGEGGAWAAAAACAEGEQLSDLLAQARLQAARKDAELQKLRGADPPVWLAVGLQPTVVLLHCGAGLLCCSVGRMRGCQPCLRARTRVHTRPARSGAGRPPRPAGAWRKRPYRPPTRVAPAAAAAAGADSALPGQHRAGHQPRLGPRPAQAARRDAGVA